MKDSGVEPDAITLNTLLEAAGRANVFEQAIRVFEDMKSRGLTPKERSFRVLLGACGVAGNLVSAFLIFSELKRSGACLNTAYNALLQACGHANDIEAALSVFEDMKRDGIELDADAYSALLSITSSADFLTMEKARERLSSVNLPADPVESSENSELHVSDDSKTHLLRVFMLFMEMKNSGLQPDRVAYNSLMHACASAGDSKRAVKVLASMRSQGIDPDVVSYTSLMRACCVEGNLDRAFDVLQALQNDGLVASNLTYVTLIGGCLRAGDVERALELLETIELDFTHLLPLYQVVVEHSCSSGNIFEAVDILKRMQSAGVRPNPELLSQVALIAREQGLHEISNKLFYVANIKKPENNSERNELHV
mmetsp:Transcript_4846/g.8451  ORF Transcript_4846/g.8451 Transcript_4846/m.8451 type:complete len:368 (-) Transcript_4846:199-1302(-)